MNWPMVRLGDVCEVRAGATHHGIEAENGAYPVYGSGGYICQATQYRCPANTVTVGRKGTLDKPLLIKEPFWNIDTCFGLIPDDSVDAEFLWRFCQSFDFYKLIPAIGRPSTNSDAIKSIQFPLPPLSVQKEIVERLEKELGEADRLAAKFKEIALKADAEFKAELDETFKQVEGEKVRLGDVCEFRRGLTYTKADEVKESSKVVLRSNNIDLNTGKLAFEELKCLREDFQVPREKYVFANTILMCMANGSKQHLGKVAFIADDLNYAFGGFMGLLVPHGIDAKYFYMTLTAQQFREHIKGLQAGANINNLKFSDLENYPVTMPPLDMQAKIVAKLDAAKEKCAQLKAAAERGLKAAEDLRKAILAEAFQTEKVE